MFAESERKIFRFNNGKRPDACGDPMLIHTRLFKAAFEDGKDIDDLIRKIDQGFNDNDEALKNKKPVPGSFVLAMEYNQKLIEYVHRAFGTQPIDEDGNGLTGEEAQENMNRLMEFMDSAKKNGVSSPPESLATAGPPEAAGNPDWAGSDIL